MCCISGLTLQHNVELIINTTGVAPDHRLQQLTGKMSSFLLNSNSHNTNKAYFSSFNGWRTFIIEHGVKDLPS